MVSCLPILLVRARKVSVKCICNKADFICLRLALLEIYSLNCNFLRQNGFRLIESRVIGSLGASDYLKWTLFCNFEPFCHFAVLCAL